MAENSKIEWTDHTFNPWIGCTRVSPGCDHCYAATMAHRRQWAEFEPGAPRHRTSPAYWRQPLRWNRQAEANGVRARVFPSLCDPFDVEVDPRWLAELLELVEATPWLDWLLLTKRPHAAAKVLAKRGAGERLARRVDRESGDGRASRAEAARA